MTETIDKNIRIPIEVEGKEHTGHSIRSVVVSAEKGIKALYCNGDNVIIAYLFAKNKEWTFDKAKDWADSQAQLLAKIEAVKVDQLEEFLKLVVTYKDDVTEEWTPNSDSFVLEKDMEGETLGVGKEEASEMELLKVDDFKQIVYGVFLVPEKADHHGDVISEEDIEKVAHGFLVEYRTIDEMHKNVIQAEIVESAISWADNIKYYGKKLKKGTWFGAIKIKDKDVWGKVLSGEYKAFSVRIAGVREPIEEKS